MNYLIKTSFIVFLLLAIGIIKYYPYKKEGKEGFAETTTQSTDAEALKNIASLYNGDKLVVKDAQVTGILDVNNALSIKAGDNRLANIDWRYNNERKSLILPLRDGSMNFHTNKFNVEGSNVYADGFVGKKNNTQICDKDGNHYIRGGALYLDTDYFCTTVGSTPGDVACMTNGQFRKLINFANKLDSVTGDTVSLANGTNMRVNAGDFILTNKSLLRHTHGYSRNQYAAVHSGYENVNTGWPN